MTQDVEMAARYAGANGGAYPPRLDGKELDDDGKKKRTGKETTAPISFFSLHAALICGRP